VANHSKVHYFLLKLEKRGCVLKLSEHSKLLHKHSLFPVDIVPLYMFSYRWAYGSNHGRCLPGAQGIHCSHYPERG